MGHLERDLLDFRPSYSELLRIKNNFQFLRRVKIWDDECKKYSNILKVILSLSAGCVAAVKTSHFNVVTFIKVFAPFPLRRRSSTFLQSTVGDRQSAASGADFSFLLIWVSQVGHCMLWPVPLIS